MLNLKEFYDNDYKCKLKETNQKLITHLGQANQAYKLQIERREFEKWINDDSLELELKRVYKDFQNYYNEYNLTYSMNVTPAPTCLNQRFEESLEIYQTLKRLKENKSDIDRKLLDTIAKKFFNYETLTDVAEFGVIDKDGTYIVFSSFSSFNRFSLQVQKDCKLFENLHYKFIMQNTTYFTQIINDANNKRNI